MVWRKVELKPDVSSSIGISGKFHLAATAYLPNPAQLVSRPIVIFAVPGGGYSRHYFDMHFEGRDNYSQAEYHVARGMIFISLDHFCVGDSSHIDPHIPTLEMLAAAQDKAVRELMRQLEAGVLADGFPALKNPACIGIGQSMGGNLCIMTQARHETFHAIAPLGFSAIHTILPQPTFEAIEKVIRGSVKLRHDNLNAETIGQFQTQITDFVYHHHWEDVPEDILKLDKGTQPLPKFRSATMPFCAAGGLIPGCVAAEAAAIEVPVFIGLGARDVCNTPRYEPAAYVSSPDITLFIVPMMAHMHNFASTRELMWRRLDQWLSQVAQV